MDSAAPLKTDDSLRPTPVAADVIQGAGNWVRSASVAIPKSSLKPVIFSFADQALAVGSTFVANVALARTQSREEYGMFALCYSVFTFLAGIHNATMLDPCTVYGSGRYRDRFSGYLRLMIRINAFVALSLTVAFLFVCLVLYWAAPHLFSRALLGLGATVGVLLSGTFLRRVFYLKGQPALAAQASLLCFVTVSCGLWLTAKAQLLNNFSVFLILAVGWIVAGLSAAGKMGLNHTDSPFLDSEPGYWREHWNYSRWILAAALVFQFATQGYYWLVAGILSVKQVAELRALSLIVAPVDQLFIALSFLVLPALAARYASGNRQGFLFLVRRYGLGVLSTTLVFVFAVRVAGRPALHLLYAGKFDELAPLLYLLAFLPLIMGIGNALNDALKAVELPKVVFLAYVCSAATTFVGGIPLVIRFHLPGAVYGMLLSAAAYTVALVLGFFLLVYRRAGRAQVS